MTSNRCSAASQTSVVFTSPIAAQLLDGSNGVLRSKEALRSYWSEGLRRIPDCASR